MNLKNPARTKQRMYTIRRRWENDRVLLLLFLTPGRPCGLHQGMPACLRGEREREGEREGERTREREREREGERERGGREKERERETGS